MKHLVLFLTALTLMGCKAATSADAESPIQADRAEHTQDNSEGHRPQDIKEEVETSVRIEPKTGDLKPFDRNDKTTWGTVVETTAEGIPTRYLRILPNGDSRNLIFSHGLDTSYIGVTPDGSPGSLSLHWNRPNRDVPIVVLNATTEPYWGGAISEAVRDWNESEMFEVRMGYFTGEDQSEAAKLKACEDIKAGFILVCNDVFLASPKDQGFLGFEGGFAEILATPKGHIYAAKITINSEFSFAKNDVVGLNKAAQARKFVACHEIGHTLGLGHPDLKLASSRGSCMGLIKVADLKFAQEPNQHDLDELKRTYTHSHDDDVAMGYVCTKESNSRTTRSFMQRLEFNGIEAIAQTELREDSEPHRQSYKRSVIIVTRDQKKLHYSWSLPNPNKMRQHKHKQGQSGEFPALHTAKVTVFDASQYMAVDYKMAEAVLSAKVNTIRAFVKDVENERVEDVKNSFMDANCEVLSGQKLRDVSHFIPPKNGSSTGSYTVNEIERDADGSYVSENGHLVKLDDYELFYSYIDERKEQPKAHLIDPVITPMDR